MAGRAKLQQKRWHLDGGIEATAGQSGEESSSKPSTYLGNYNGDNAQSLALVAYTGNYYDLINYPDTTFYVVDGNYVHTDNNFTHEDKAKLAASYNYVLPVATEKKLGGIKVGDHLEVRQAVDKNGEPYGDFDRLSVIESHFIYVQNATASNMSEVPRNSAGALTLTPLYSPTGDRATGNYISYNDMAFFSQDPIVKEREVNGKTIKIHQEYMEQGGLWWTTRNAGGWIRIQDQFNIVSFNDRVGKVYPVGMDDWLVDCEDYDANMVGAMARSGHGGGWTVIKSDTGRVLHQFFNGCSIDSLKTGDSGWALMGALSWDAEKKVLKPDHVNSPTGGIVSGTFWKLDGLPTLPTYRPGPDPPYMPDTYRGAGRGSFFFMPDGQDRIWVKRESEGKWDKNDWFYLEQLPIATRSRLGGIIVGNGLDITESGVLSIVGSVTSWTGKQGNRRVNEVVAMNGDYDATMITFGREWAYNANVDYELKDLRRVINEKAPINSPAFTGSPTTPTPNKSLVESSNRIANTNWVSWYVREFTSNIVEYELPPATTSTLGGIIVGDGLKIDSNGRLSVNIQGGDIGDVIIIDTEISATSTNPVENKAIYDQFAEVFLTFNSYVEKENGTASGLALTDSSIQGTTYITLPDGTKDDRLATTKFVDNAIKAYIQTLDPGGGSGGDPSIIVNPYTLPIASASTLGGVRVTGNDGIKITNNGTISVDETYVKDYLEGDSGLKYIRAQEDITSGRLSDIPPNSSGVTKISALYSPAARDMEGHYLKYNAGDDPDTYILWFCDFETNDSYYYINRSDGTHGWAKTLSVEGLANFEDFDLSKYAKIDSPILTGAPEIHSPTADYLYLPDENSPRIATTGFVQTAINYNLTNLKKASTNEYGIVKIKQNGGIAVTNGEISMDGVVSFKGRKGAVEPRDNDYDAGMIKYSGALTGPSVQTALDSVDTRYAKLISPNFTGTPTIYNLPIATQNYVRDWKPIAKTDTLGMIRVGDGLTIDPNTGILSTAGAVTGWTGNQGLRQSGEVIARAGDYNSNMIYYDPQDNSKTVRSELDLKAYKHEAWMRKDIYQIEYPLSITSSEMGRLPSLYTGGKYGTKGGHLMLPIGTTNNAYGYPHCGAIILKNDAASYNDNVVAVPNLYIATTYHQRRESDTRSYVRWGNEIRLLTTRDFASPNFTGTPTINGNPIAVSRVAGDALGLVKNGGNVVVNASGEMNYTLPVAGLSNGAIGGVKIGEGISRALDGTISVTGAVTSFKGRAGDVVPENGDYNAEQISYDATDSVKTKIESINTTIEALYNTEHYSELEIGAEITATLAELNA